MAHNFVGTHSCPTPHGCPTVRPDPTRLWYVLRQIVPGHSSHENDFERQISVGTLVSSQERRALFVPLMNRLQTAGQPLVFVPSGSHRNCTRICRGIMKTQRRLLTNLHPVRFKEPRMHLVLPVLNKHDLHEKGSHSQKGIVPLFGGQEQRAFLVPLINR